MGGALQTPVTAVAAGERSWETRCRYGRRLLLTLYLFEWFGFFSLPGAYLFQKLF